MFNRIALTSILLISLQGCAIIAGTLGTSPAIIQAAQLADLTKLGVDIVLVSETEKTATDHIVSKVKDKDCQTGRFLKNGEYCTDNVKVDVNFDLSI